MKNFFLSIFFALSLTLIPGCVGRDTSAVSTSTGANVPANSTLPPKAVQQQAVVDKAIHADDGSTLKTVKEIDARIAQNKENIALLEKANVLLEQMKVEVQEAIDQTYLYCIGGFFGLGAIVLGVVGVIFVPPIFKTLFVKLAVVCGLLAAITTGTAIYLPAVFIAFKWLFIALAVALVLAGIYYLVIFLKAIHAEGTAGNLTEISESLPVVGKVIAKVNADLKNATVSSDVSKVETTIGSGAVKIEAVAKPFIQKVEAEVAKVEAEIKKVL